MVKTAKVSILCVALIRGKLMETKVNSLVGFAVLRANYNAQAPSYMDNFQGFALDVLASNHPEPALPNFVSGEIEKRFGLHIPDLVVGKILRRSRMNSFVQGDAKSGFTLTADGLKSAPRVGKIAKDYERKQAELVTKFSEYVSRNHAAHVDRIDADLAGKLGSYLEAHAVPLLTQSLRGDVPQFRKIEPDYDFLISSFLTHLAEKDSVGFGYVEDAAKGAILATVVTMDTSTMSQSLTNLTLYLDSPILLDVLGYHGEIPKLAVNQLLVLARDLGAKIAAFEHNVQEVEGVLYGAEMGLRFNNKRSEFSGRVLANFISEKETPADVAGYRENLDRNLRTAGVDVKARPNNFAEYGLDENRLEDELKGLIRYRNPAALRCDVDSLSAIHRLRRGENSSRIERTRAVLITTNGEVARASQSMAGEDHTWPLAMTGSAVASLLWVRSSAVSEDLPMTQLMSAAYAGMQPDGYLWEKYLDEVEKLERKGELTSEDALLLRAGMEPRAALMETTLGESDEISPETLVAVLDRLKEDSAKPFVDALAAAQEQQSVAYEAAAKASTDLESEQEANAELLKRVKAAEEESRAAQIRIEGIENRDTSRIDAIRKRSENHARIISRLITSIVGVLVVLIAAWTHVSPEFPNIQVPKWISNCVLLIGGLIVVLPIIQTLIPGNVREWAIPLEKRLANSLAKSALRRAGFEH